MKATNAQRRSWRSRMSQWYLDHEVDIAMGLGVLIFCAAILLAGWLMVIARKF